MCCVERPAPGQALSWQSTSTTRTRSMLRRMELRGCAVAGSNRHPRRNLAFVVHTFARQPHRIFTNVLPGARSTSRAGTTSSSSSMCSRPCSRKLVSRIPRCEACPPASLIPPRCSQGTRGMLSCERQDACLPSRASRTATGGLTLPSRWPVRSPRCTSSRQTPTASQWSSTARYLWLALSQWHSAPATPQLGPQRAHHPCTRS